MGRLPRQYAAALGLGGLMLAALACNFPGATANPGQDAAEVTPSLPPTATELVLAPTLPQEPIEPPTLTPDPDGTPTPDLAPTPLPDPTEIVPEFQENPDLTQTATAGPPPAGDAEGEDAEAQGGSAVDRSGTGIFIEPQLGEPNEIILVTGFGFQPNEEITLHWSPLNGDTGPEYTRFDADEAGGFERLVRVPPAENWPGGPPDELDYIQMRAIAESDEDFIHFANYRYVIRFGSPTGLVLTFNNPDLPYTVQFPNGWAWNWTIPEGQEAGGADNVRLVSPGGNNGFIRVVSAASAEAGAATIMAAEAPGQPFQTTAASVGAVPGLQTTTGDLTVYFFAQGGRVYGLGFRSTAQDVMSAIVGSFRITG